MHDLPLIATIAVAFTAALVLGLLAQRFGFPPIVGYLLAGVTMGPYTPGFAGDIKLAHQLAEVGVILLMFGVGLHFHWQDLAAVKGVAIPGAIGQSLVAAGLSWAAFLAFGLPSAAAAVVGMALAVASTVVLMRVLMDADALETTPGHVAVGWLLVEDVITVVVLVLIPVLGDDPAGEVLAAPPSLWSAIGWALLKLGALVAIVITVGSRVVPWALVRVAKLRSRELFTLTVLVFSVAMAAGAFAFFGASMALGAFMAGMLVAQSPVSHQAAADALPLRDAFAVLFFVSVGMAFDPAFLLQEPAMVLAALAVILLVKPLAALAIVAVLGHSARTALTVALGLAQIGEFSFILSDLAAKHGIMTSSGSNVLVAAAIVSITINPLLFRSLDPLEAWLRRRPRLWSLLNGAAERRAQELNAATVAQEAGAAEDRRLAIVVGYGPVGRSVHRLLREAGWSPLVIDLNADAVTELASQQLPAIYGDASHESILEQAGIQRASHVVLTLPQPGARLAVVAAAKNLNPRVRILVRAHYIGERESLEEAGATGAVFEEAEAAVALARLVLTDTGAKPEAVQTKVRDLRLRLDELVGRVQDVFPTETQDSLVDALSRGATLLDYSADGSEEAIERLVGAIPAFCLPEGADIPRLVMAREAEVSTDLGRGVAAPHARCARLDRSIVAFGRTEQGVAFSSESTTPVRLIFLLLTPLHRPDQQLALLSQVARLAADDSLREGLLQATTAKEVAEIFGKAPATAGAVED